MASLDISSIKGFIVSSVVPTLETSWMDFAAKYLAEQLTKKAISVSHVTQTGITVKTENPAEVGADRIVNAVAAWEHFHSSLIVVDFGTAITFDCVTAEKEYIGGAIMPGIAISLDALAGRTAKLPRIDIDKAPDHAIGSSTVSAMQSGILYGFGGMIDRMTEKLTEELSPGRNKIPVIATGGMAQLIGPYSKVIKEIDPLLTLKGLQIIHSNIE
jgi:type III pantothenate kinase